MNSLIDRFTQLEATLALAGLDISPSEVHGTVVGAIANHLKTGLTPDLLNLIEPGSDSNDGRLRQLNESLYDLYRENSELLLEGKEGFDLVLPHMDDAFSQQVEGVAGWAKGYLLGLLHNNVFSIDQLPESGPEIARDFMDISEAEADQEDEADAKALVELHEYVKVGAQLIFEFIYSERANNAPESTH